MSLDVLITGAGGFIGSGLLEACCRSSLTALGIGRKPGALHGVDFAVTDYSPRSVADILSRHTPKAVVHAAGSASVQHSLADPYADFQSSVALLHNVLEGVRRWGGATDFVFLSSAGVYGNPSRLPVPEDVPAAPISPYGAHKLLCEELLRCHHGLYRLPVIAVRAFSLFGPLQKRLLLWELYQQIRQTGRIRLYGTGREQRDYLDLETFTGLILGLLGRVRPGFTTVNVASGVSHSVLELIAMFRDITGMELPVETAEATRKGDPIAWRADVTRLEGILGEPVRFDIAQSLARCVAEWDASSRGAA